MSSTGRAIAGALRPDTSTITAAPVRTILFIDFLIFVSFLKGVAFFFLYGSPVFPYIWSLREGRGKVT
jgi:hypothetical protein